MDVEPFKELIAKEHKMADEPKEAVAEKKYTKLETPENEIVIAPYDAKNIYLMQLHNENKQWTPESEPVVTLFNEYFGGGMNTIVFPKLVGEDCKPGAALAFITTILCIVTIPICLFVLGIPLG